MNLSKVSLPSPKFLQYYYWFSQISFTITWCIMPILFYTIFTQSKQLKGFKWYILNQSIWSLAFETILGFFKPIIFVPFVGGFPLYILQDQNNDGSYIVIEIALTLGVISGINFVAALFVTIGSRYTTTVQTRFTKWITQKILIYLALTALLIIHPILIYATIPTFKKDLNVVHEEANSYDEFFKTIEKLPFVFIASENIKVIVILLFIILIVVFILGIAVMFLFIYLVRKHNNSLSVSKIQRSMIISSVVEILVSSFFLDLPIAILLVFMLFEIPHTSMLSCICLSVISLHTILEFLATLYFVLPYRKFIQKQFFRFYKKVNQKNKVLQVFKIPVFVEVVPMQRIK